MTEIFGIPTQALFGQLLIGLINGSFYALLSLGLAVIFGLLGIVNFAHGALYMIGAYVAFLLAAPVDPRHVIVVRFAEAMGANLFMTLFLTLPTTVAVGHRTGAGADYYLVSLATLLGFLADPAYGGNRGGAGWRAIGHPQHPHGSGGVSDEQVTGSVPIRLV